MRLTIGGQHFIAQRDFLKMRIQRVRQINMICYCDILALSLIRSAHAFIFNEFYGNARINILWCK